MQINGAVALNGVGLPEHAERIAETRSVHYSARFNGNQLRGGEISGFRRPRTSPFRNVGLTLQDGSHMLSSELDNQLPICTVQNPRTRKASNTSEI